jgi:hypothetical protein
VLNALAVTLVLGASAAAFAAGDTTLPPAPRVSGAETAL